MRDDIPDLQGAYETIDEVMWRNMTDKLTSEEFNDLFSSLEDVSNRRSNRYKLQCFEELYAFFENELKRRES